MTTHDNRAVKEYARLLLKYHELDPRGEHESPELDNLCDEMDAQWSQMNGAEQQRMNGLSQDLYALADGRAGVAMTKEERNEWIRKREDPELSADERLSLLREPYPDDLPGGTIPFLQGQCWEVLGDINVSDLFTKAASESQHSLNGEGWRRSGLVS